MAKSIAGRNLPGRTENHQVAMLKVEEPEYWSPAKGLLLTPRLSRVPPEHAVEAKNMMLAEQTLLSRYGVAPNSTGTFQIMAIVGFVTPSQVGYLLRVRTDRLEVWNGSTWANVYTGFSGGVTDYWSFANWGNEIMMCNGIDKIFRYNPETGESGFIAESVPAKHISVFGGRVIATSVNDGTYKSYRVQWSVKNDNEDWTGEGSGWEDLYAAPGGRVDSAHGCFPITDDTALVIRERSIWQMSTTGQVLAPFRFSRLTGELGTRCRRSITEVPGGYAMVSRDSVIVVGLSNIATIGDAVRDDLIASITDYDAAVGEYDSTRSEYRLATGQTVWRYSFREQGWTRDVYVAPVRDMTYVDYKVHGRTIDSLAGTIDALSGTIDQLVDANNVDTMFLIQYDGNRSSIVYELPNYGGDANLDAQYVDSEIVVATGLIQAGSVRDKSKVIEIQVEYESDSIQTLIFEYTTDGGTTWTTYSTTQVGVTTGPQILSVRKSVVSHNIQLRVRSQTLGRLRILSFTPRVVQEAKVRP